MPNNLSTDLQVDIAHEAAITVLQNRLAPLRALTTFFNDPRAYSRQTLQIPKADATSAVQSNPTNFESGTANVSNVKVDVNHLSISGNITAQERNLGHSLRHQFDIKLAALANKIMDTTMGVFNGTNFASVSNVVQAASGFGASNLQTLWGNIEDAAVKNIILDGAYFAKFLPQDRDTGYEISGMYGFDGFFHNNRWGSAGTNIAGIACDPQAAAVISGLPDISEEVNAELLASTEIPLEDLGLSIQYNRWANSGSRADWFSFDVVFGAAALDTSASAASFVLTA